MDIVIISLLAVLIILAVIIIVLLLKVKSSGNDNTLSTDIAELGGRVEKLSEKTIAAESAVKMLAEGQENSQSRLRSEVMQSVSKLGENVAQTLKVSSDGTTNQLAQFERRLESFEKNNIEQMKQMRDSVSRQLLEIKDDNGKRLEQINATVNEKLQTALEEKMTKSFKNVSEQLENVYKGLGEMQTLASGVGDLKKVLSNVKNRGILGEMQLGAILSEILAPEQYETDIATIPGSKERVEFAVKLPGGENGTVYLPIDSKFPGDTYSALRDAVDSGNKEAVDAAYKALAQRIKGCAKDIHEKYIMPPYTTNFGIMFLPFEGLYAEVVNHGLVEELQRDYKINVAGPSTMAALLNSLYMGFRTLAIQKRSNEVWNVLSSVRSEFENFAGVLETTQKHLKQVDSDLDKLVGVRTRAINRQLRNVELPESTSETPVIALNDD